MSNSVFTNNLRLELIASGERSGTWGTATNTNLSLIADAFGFGTEEITTNADTHTTTIANAASDAGRAMYIKYTGTLDSECTITIGPNDLKRVHIIENATSGSQNIVISQGSGSNVTIPNGSVKVVYLTGDTESNVQNVVDAFTDLDVAGTFKVAGNTTVGGTLTSTGAVTANAGVSIDNITIDGTEIDLSSGDLTLDVAGDIVLDAGGGDVLLKDDTATFGSFTNTSGNLIIKSGTTTAATFSGANVTLAGTVVTGGLTTLGGNLVIPNDGNIGSVGDTDAIAISSGGVVTMSAGINVSGGTITGTLATAAQTAITSVGDLGGGSITSGFGNIDNGSSSITTTGTITGGTITTSCTISFGSLTDGTTTITSVDQDISSVSSSHDTLATALAIKTYVDSQTVTATGVVGTGTGNTAIGTNALDSVQSDANRNTAFGFNAGTGITTGDDNTAFGFEAAKNVDNDQGNTAIGAYSFGGVTSTATSTGSHATGGPGTAVGYKALGNIVNAEKCTAVGYEALLSLTGGNGNVGVGHGAGKDVQGGNSNVYVGTRCAEQCTGTGNTAIGHQAFIFRNGQHDHSVAVGYTTGYRAVGDDITLLGAYAGYGNSSVTCDHTGTTAVGYKSLEVIQSGNNNTAVGSSSLPVLTTADKNTSVGFESGKRLTTGTNNVILGNKAGMGVITGDHNVAIGGEGAMGFGDISLLENESSFNAHTVGDRNVAIGSRAMGNAPTQSDATERNVAVGYLALYTVQAGDNNTGIGYGAGDSITDGSNNTCLGNGSDTASATTSNSITLGNSSITSLRCQDTSISSLSDERDKKDIVDSTYGLDLLNTFRPVSFTWNKRVDTTTKPSWMSDEEWKEEQAKQAKIVDPYKDKPAIGFIAQELRDAIPESDRKRLDLVDEQNPDRLEAKQGKLVPILVKAIQELSAKNDALEARIKKLEG